MGDYSKHCKCGQQKEIYLYGIQYIKTSRPCALTVTGGSDGLLAAKGPGLYRCAAKAERRPRGWAGSCRYRTHANSQGAAQQRALSAWAPGTLSSPDDRGSPGNLKGCKPVQQLSRRKEGAGPHRATTDSLGSGRSLRD